YHRFVQKKEMIEEDKKRLSKLIIKPEKHIQDILIGAKSTPLKDATNALDLLKRPEITYEHLDQMNRDGQEIPDDVKEQVEIQVKYAGYIKKANEQVDRKIGRASCRE